MPLSGGAGGHLYVNRGDPDAWDFSTGDFTIDADWHDLDLSSIVTDSNAELVHLQVIVKDDAANLSALFRKNGQTNLYNRSTIYTEEPNTNNAGDLILACDSDQKIEYFISAGMNEIYLVVKGWFKVA